MSESLEAVDLSVDLGLDVVVVSQSHFAERT